MSFGKTESTNATAPMGVWKPQQDFLKNLWGSAQGLYQSQGGALGKQAFNSSRGLLQGLGGYASPTTNPAFQNLQQRAEGSNPYLDQQIGGLGNDISQFAQRLMAQQGQQSGLNGGFGGGRMQVAQGMIGQDALRQFSQGANTLRSNAYQQGGQAAGMLGSLSNDYLGQMGNIYNMGMNPFQSQWQPLGNLAQIIGNPAITGGGGGGGGGGFNFGLGTGSSTPWWG